MAMKQASHAGAVRHPERYLPMPYSQKWDWRDYFVNYFAVDLPSILILFVQDYCCNNWFNYLWRSLTLQGKFISIRT